MRVKDDAGIHPKYLIQTERFGMTYFHQQHFVWNMQAEYEAVDVQNLSASICAHRLIFRRITFGTNKKVGGAWARKSEQVNESSEY